MQIIIIEINKVLQNKIDEIIKEVSFECNCDIQTSYYDSYNDELKKEIENSNTRKVYILNIDEEDNLNGINIAKQIRQNDWDSEIIAFSKCDKRFESIRCIHEVFDFLETFHNFAECLKDDLINIYLKKYDTEMLIINHRDDRLNIFYKSITYISRDKQERKIEIHTVTGLTLKARITLVSTLELLDSRFAQTHKSCLVNRDMVVKYNYSKGYFILANGEKVPLLSKYYRDDIEI